MEIKGYKAFNSDWTCRGKQYTCPGEFEEGINLEICERGMHFCEKLKDCFNHYAFSPKTKVAEVVAYGNVKRDIGSDTKMCTDKLRIVRELNWAEVLELVNTGSQNTGYQNTGNHNTGDYNSGSYNSGNYNSGNYNSGNHNVGVWNAGDWNAGYWNTGYRNTGKYNAGDYNSGSYNSGNYNVGVWNAGDWNTGCWNKGDYNTGAFCTDSEMKIKLFDKPSSWSFEDFYTSEAFRVMSSFRPVTWVYVVNMTEEEKKAHPESKTTGGYLKKNDIQEWWDNLPEEDRKEVMSLPNFDADIFRKCTEIMIEDRDSV